MDLPWVSGVVCAPQLPARPGPMFADGDAWLAGGTALFSTEQPAVRRLLDLTTLGWPALTWGAGGLEISATCTIAELAALRATAAWPALALAERACRCFLSAQAVWNAATVGGNLCAALPAGPMAALVAVLDGRCEVWPADGGPARWLPVRELVIGDGRNSLGPGDVLRSVHLPAFALAGRAALRRASLHRQGRSAALVAGRLAGQELVLVVTAATTRPHVLKVAADRPERELVQQLESEVGPDGWQQDVHGDADWRAHLTGRLLGQVRAELLGDQTGRDRR